MPTVLKPDTPVKGRSLYINGRWQPAVSGETLDVIAPGDGIAYSSIAMGDREDVDAAVFAARSAVEGGPWSKFTATERGRVLSRLSGLILDNAAEIAAIEARDTGKPLKTAAGDTVATARYFEYYGGAADKLHGETIPYLDGFMAWTLRVPLGVTAHIIPWNLPIQIFARSVAPALACGNAAVVKPAEDACLGVVRLVELAEQAGLPSGALNLITGTGPVAGAALASHPGIDFISFTGSPEVGSLIQIAAAKHHVGVTLELGGKSPHVVFGDADLDLALPAIVAGIVANAGQTCSAGSRVLVERDAYDAFVVRLAERFSTVVAGTPEMNLDLGPLVNAKQKARVEGFEARARAAGVPILASGKIAEGVPAGGFFVVPRIYGPVPRSNELAHEEVFGPVLSVLPFDDESDAVRLANGTEYGLMAAVWTANGSRALRVARGIRAGQVYVNGFGAGGGIELPFGGMKKSGHGREKGFEALYEFSTSQTLIVRHG
jgi:aldehyde dehydrogenase (NAD+)